LPHGWFPITKEPSNRAKAELLYGTNVKLRRIAEEIIVNQQQEIVAIRLAIGRPPPKE
jgi:hypothetical protein